MQIRNSRKESIMSQIYDNFVHSSDYNGLPLSNLCSSSDEEAFRNIIELVQEETVQVLSQSHVENPHIIQFGFMPKDEQIRCLQENETVCLYPSSSYLKKHRDVSDYSLKPFDKMMALGYPQLKACYFKYDILSKYAFDSRMNMNFSDYSGSIKSNDDVDDNNYINLDTFGIGRQNETIVIVSYPRYLRNMSTSNQFQWYGYLINDDTDCKTLEDYNKNLFSGSWAFPNTVYQSILQEMHNINELTKIAFEKELFSHEYSKDELQRFDMLSFPSLDCYNQFLLLLEKVVISNIDINFLKLVIKTTDKDGKQLGALACLKKFITKVNIDCVDKIYKPLHSVRRERQAPAHKIEHDRYSYDFLQKQHQMCCDIYKSLNRLRLLFESHPKVKGYSVKYPNTQYLEI